MSTMTQDSSGPSELQTLVQTEISKARNETRPTSRQQLADIVHARTGMPVADAFAFVDSYCDEHEPGVPGYLAEEFAVPYLKVVAVVNVLVAIGIFYNGVRVYHTGKPGWPWFSLGVIFFGLGALSWVKSIEREVERRRRPS